MLRRTITSALRTALVTVLLACGTLLGVLTAGADALAQQPMQMRQGPPPAAPAAPPPKREGPDPLVDTSVVLFPGQIIWQRALASPPAFPPAASGDTLFVLMKDGTLAAVSTITSEVRWALAETSTIAPSAGANLVAGVRSRTVWVRESVSGSLRWQAELPAAASAPPLVDAAGVVVGTDRGDVFCLAAADGHVVWQQAAGAPAAIAAAGPSGDVIVALADGRVLAYSVASGTVSWSRQLRGRPLSLSVVEDRVFVGSDDNFLYVLATGDGDEDWKWRTGGDLAGGVAAQGRGIAYVALDSMLRLHNRGGSLIWKTPVPSRPVGGAVFLSDRIVYADVSFDLRGYATRNGEPAGSYAVGDRVMHTPVLAPQAVGLPARLIVLTARGLILALGRPIDGIADWITEPPGTAIRPEHPIDWVNDPKPISFRALMGLLLPADVVFPLNPAFSDPAASPVRTVPGRALPAEELLPFAWRWNDPPLGPLSELPGRLLPREQAPVITPEPPRRP